MLRVNAHDHEFIAALSTLPPHLSPLHTPDQRDQLQSIGIPPTTLGILDALSALCVRDTTDVFSVTFLLQEDEIRLLVATAGNVPDHVERRLEAVWQFMRMCHDGTLQQHRGGMSRSMRDHLARDFAVQHCRYAMSALRARLTDDVAIILRCMRRLLEFSGRPDAGIVVQLDVLGHDDPALQDSQRQLLQVSFDRLTFLRDTVSAASLTDDQLVAVVGCLSELAASLKDHLRTCANTIFTMMEAMCDTPVRHLVRRVLWLSNHCDYVTAFAMSEQFARFANLRLHVKRLPPVTRTVPSAFQLAYLQGFAKRFYKGPLANFDSDFRSRILDALGPAGDITAHQPATVDVYLHGEMVLLDYLHSLHLQHAGYIGSSEPSCLPCYLLLRAYSDLSNRHGLYVSGTDGQTSLGWAPPYLDLDMDVSICFTGELLTQFCAAWRNLSLALAADRRGEQERDSV